MENNIIQFNENCIRCSRKRKRDSYDYDYNDYDDYDTNSNYRKRKFEEDLDDIIINKFQKIEIINYDSKYINNKKRPYESVVDINFNLQIKKQKIKKTYNCTLHDDTKEICLIYNCTGNININKNNVYYYIK
jgi:hypothetical protein